MMFNPERKLEFINNYNGITSFNYINNLFAKCEPMERSLNKDVCDFIKPEIVEMFISFASFSEGTLLVYKSILKQYTDFCCTNNLSRDNINHFEEINKSELSKYVNQFFKGKIYICKEKLEEFCEDLLNPCDAFVLYCLFEGIKGDFCEEITEMQMKHINKTSKTVNLCTGRTIKVSDGFIRWAEIANSQTEYKGIRPYNYNDSSTPYILKTKYDRTLESNAKKRSRIFKKITSIKTSLEAQEISIPNLYNSGLVYHLTKRMKEKDMTAQQLHNSDDSAYNEILNKYNVEKKDYCYYVFNELFEKYLGEST